MLTKKQDPKSSSDLDDSKTKSEIRHNNVSRIISIVSMIFTIGLAAWNGWQQVILNEQKAKIEELQTDIQTITLVDNLIDDLTKNEDTRELALSALYGVLVLEPKQHNEEPKYPFMMVEIADTILDNSYQKGNLNESKKALSIIGELDPTKHQEWVNKKSKTNSDYVDKTLGIKEKGGLVYIQYNDESQKEKIEELRRKLSAENWNTPGAEFIPKSKSDYKGSDIRYFNEKDKDLAKTLKATAEEILGHPDCLKEPENLSKSYTNVSKKQLELWIDLDCIPK
jgi:cell division protein FtsI/penicillin-binding protein 2